MTVHTKISEFSKKSSFAIILDSLILNMIGHTFRFRNYSDST